MSADVLIIYNGGTIGMQPSDQGYAPVPGYLQQQMQSIPAFAKPGLPRYDIIEQHPLIDSAHMHPDRWWGIAKLIEQYHDQYRGFVILHGTDTLAYTASALPFMLENLRKPVILTGSQIPLCEIRNDAQENLVTSLMIAAHYPIPEVCLYFGGKLMRGCRATKLDATGFQAFFSPNYPLLGDVGIDIDIYWERIQAMPKTHAPLKIRAVHEATVGALRLFPGISASVLENMLRPPLQGLVLETFGVGNGPSNDPIFLRVLKEATAAGIVLVNCSQCSKGRIRQEAYAAGHALADCGVVSGEDLTTEAALAKLYYLLSEGYSPPEVRLLMGQNLRGEMRP